MDFTVIITLLTSAVLLVVGALTAVAGLIVGVNVVKWGLGTVITFSGSDELDRLIKSGDRTGAHKYLRAEVMRERRYADYALRREERRNFARRYGRERGRH